MLSELALSALTDVILASLQAFAAGLLFRPGLRTMSAAGLWAWTMTLIAAVFLVGAIDHGFFEPVDHPLHPTLMSVNRALVAVVSFLMIAVAAVRFLGPQARRVVLALGAIGNAAVVVLVFLSDNFFIVIAGYSTALLLLLVLSIAGLRRGTGSPAMIAGIVITFGASALPLVGYEGIAGLGIYATYHIALMPAVVAFYFAGRALDDDRPRPAGAPVPAPSTTTA
ncbi:DUF6962 family protein [Caenispirillum bisanense]|uniref:Uncharacterized protein n=1 Tax=Caenispirillum bisanense TaxID=414052 RepID=A0A286GXW4_9PROT|nr:hypothetical protein [Caenispirillum bisanense]SOD99929.1 hypothetical protein SAMN05421508_110113 [Caenispirillum bisanense]